MDTTEIMENTLTGDAKRFYDSLNEKEKQAFHIAQNHLGSLFTVEKTNGFLKWKQTQK
jgi:hypothetical protein